VHLNSTVLLRVRQNLMLGRLHHKTPVCYEGFERFGRGRSKPGRCQCLTTEIVLWYTGLVRREDQRMPGKSIGTSLGSSEKTLWGGRVKILKNGDKYKVDFISIEGESERIEKVVAKHLTNIEKELNEE
jgi:hypothetical protein